MAVLTRRSPKLAIGYNKQDVRDAIQTIEDRPRIPEGTPASSAADGYEGQILGDASYLYLYRDGQWRRTALSTF